MSKLTEQSDAIIEYWTDFAINKMLQSGLLPMVDEIWVGDSKYAERIFTMAEELYDDQRA